MKIRDPLEGYVYPAGGGEPEPIYMFIGQRRVVVHVNPKGMGYVYDLEKPMRATYIFEELAERDYGRGVALMDLSGEKPDIVLNL